MGKKLTLAEYTEQLEHGETYTVKLTSGDEVDLTLRSPAKAEAEAVHAAIAEVTADAGNDVAMLAGMRKAEHAALMACCAEVTDDNVVGILADAGDDLTHRVMVLCGLRPLADAAQKQAAKRKNSRSA